jgi:hypothetical protein
VFWQREVAVARIFKLIEPIATELVPFVPALVRMYLERPEHPGKPMGGEAVLAKLGPR